MTLELKNVRRSYDGGSSFAVEDVSFSAAPGELVALVGESGCGKTTTLKAINRLVEPTPGKVLINKAVDIDGLSVEESARRLHDRIADRSGSSR